MTKIKHKQMLLFFDYRLPTQVHFRKSKLSGVLISIYQILVVAHVVSFVGSAQILSSNSFLSQDCIIHCTGFYHGPRLNNSAEKLTGPHRAQRGDGGC